MTKQKASKDKAITSVQVEETDTSLEETTSINVAVSSNDAYAVHTGQAILSNDVIASLDEYAEAKLVTATISARLWLQVRDNLKANDMSVFDLAIVGLVEDDPKTGWKENDNRKPEVWFLEGPMNKNGTRKKVRHNFFDIMFAQSEPGKKILDEIKRVKSEELDKNYRESREATLQKAFKDRVEALRKAVALGQKIETVKMECPGLTVSLMAFEDEDGVETIADVQTPIIVSDKKNPALSRALGPTQFQKMDWDKVKANGGTMKAFNDVYKTTIAKRGTRNADVTKKIKLRITTLEQLTAYLRAIADLLDDDNMALFNRLGTEAEKTNDVPITIRDALIALQRLYARVEAKVIAIEEAEKAAIIAKAEAAKKAG